MNVGGHRITNDELREQFERLGFDDVGTFRASGNVVFEADRTREAKLAAAIEDALEDALGYAVPTFLRTTAQLRSIVEFRAFPPARVEASAGKLQVVLLKQKLSAPERRRCLAFASDDDLLAIDGREIHWLPAGGLMESAIGKEDLSGGSSTTRTMGTIEALVAKFFT